MSSQHKPRLSNVQQEEELNNYISRLSGDVNMKSILRDPVFWAFMGCFVTAIALGIKA